MQHVTKIQQTKPFHRGFSNSHYPRARTRSHSETSGEIAAPCAISEDSDCGLEMIMTVQVSEGSAIATMSQAEHEH